MDVTGYIHGSIDPYIVIIGILLLELYSCLEKFLNIVFQFDN